MTLKIALGLVFRRQPKSFHSPPPDEDAEEEEDGVAEEEGQLRWTVAE